MVPAHVNSTTRPLASEALLARQRRHLTRWLLFLLLYTTFTGAVRKWVLMGGPVSDALLLGQILLPWAFYLFAPGKRRQYMPIVLITGVLLALMAFNPLNQTIYHGLFGILLHLGWWLVGFHYLENRSLYCWDRLHGWIWLTLVVEVGLSVAQYSLPRMHFINRYATEVTTSVAFVGEAARVTGTFSFVSGYAAWLLFMNLWTWSIAVWKRRVGLVSVLVGVGIVCSLLSGGRLSLVFTLLFALFTYAHLLRRIAFHRLLFVFFFGSIGAIGLFETTPFLQQSWANFASRIEDGFRDAEYGRRTIGVIQEVIDFKGDYALLGAGLGGTYQGARALWGESYFMLQYGGYEEEPERIVLEGGYLLFFLRIGLLWLLLSHLQIPLAAKILLLVLITLFVPTVFNVYNAIFSILGITALDWSYRRALSANDAL